MKLSELARRLDLEAFQTEVNEDLAADCYTGDLLSDVMGNAPEHSVFITIQAHANTVAVAMLAGINAIFVANNRPIPSDMITAAQKEGVGIWRSTKTQYELSWMVHEELMKE